MPTYEYLCEDCGPFTAMRPMAQFRDPYACPECGAGAPRAFLSAPAIASMTLGRRGHVDGSASAPRGALGGHPAGCGCCVRRMKLPGGPFAKDGRVFTAHGPLRRSAL